MMIAQVKKITNLHRIKSLLYLRKIKPAEIAKIAGVSPITVRTILNGHGTSEKVRRTIADLLKIPYERLWNPSRHHNHHKANNNKSKKACK